MKMKKGGGTSKSVKKTRVTKPNPLGFKVLSKSSKRQKQCDKNIINYITLSCKTFSTVDDPNFTKLFELSPDIKFIKRGPLMHRIKAKFNLVATKDYKDSLDDAAFRIVHVRSFAKCSQIWNGSRRPKGSGSIRGIIGKQIGYSCITRWNRFFDCVKELLKYSGHNLNQMLEATKPRIITQLLSLHGN